MNKYIIIALCTAIAATSCYPEEKIDAPKHEPDYVIGDSSDPVDHYIYQINRNTGVFVMYEYEDREFAWNMESTSQNVLTRQEDRTALASATTYMDRVLMDHYPDSFKKQYFPFKILLAAKIDNTTLSIADRTASSGRSYLALGKLRENAMPATAEELRAARGEVNGELWGYIIFNNGQVEIPEGFFAASGDMYEINMKEEAGKDLPETLYDNGFWSYNEVSSIATTSAYVFPTHAADVSDYVQMITSHTTEQMNALMQPYPLLRVKYTQLIEAVKQATGIDLQAIGDREPTPIP